MSNNTTSQDASVPTSLNSFAVSFGINVAIASVVFLVFVCMRTKHRRIYAPREKLLNDLRIPHLPQSLFGWIVPLIKLTDDQVLEAAGLDALVLVRSYRFAAHLFLALSIYSIGVLLPINYTAENGLSNFDQMSMANIPQRSMRLWAHFISVYLFTGITLWMLNKEFREYVQLRVHFNQTKRPHAYSVLVKSIPPEDAHHDNLKKLFNFMYYNNVHNALAQNDVSKLDEYYAKRDMYCRKLEHVLYLHDHDTSAERQRPQHKTGFLGLWGEKVDSIDFFSRKLEKYNRLVEEQQHLPHQPSGSGFVTFMDLSAAAASVQMLHAQDSEAFLAVPAPEPCDVYWPNLSIPTRVKLVRTVLVAVATFFLVFFYMIPVAAVQGLTSMQALSDSIPAFEKIANSSPAVRGFLEGFLPTLALRIFFAILPMICAFFATFEGQEANSWIEMSQMAKLFYFQLFNIFLGSLLSGSIFTQIEQIVDDPTSIASLLGKALPLKSTFFINYVMLLSTGFSMGLLRIGPLIVSWIKLKFLAKTPKEITEAWAPGPTSYGTLYPELLLVFCIGLTYSTIAPFALPFCILYSGFGYLAYKYQVMYVDIPSYQSGGQFFPRLFSRIITALIVYQITLIGLMGLKASPLAVFCIPAPFVSLLGYYFMWSWYTRPGKYTPLLIAKAMDENDDPLTGDSVKELIDPLAYCKPCLKDGRAVPDRWDDDNNLVEATSEILGSEEGESFVKGERKGSVATDDRNVSITVGPDGPDGGDGEKTTIGLLPKEPERAQIK
eukprot:comp11670_c0_seq1/m.6194 comp11670_c0_seq1/g.6194  ORF comp11670_c0_seq1/g.6194 comp11670_c0_seq1/m.6194 type:complete len:776 (-) comp11670_c0_seq1:261-2588(-)